MGTDLSTLQNTLPADILKTLQAQVAADMERLGSTGGGNVIKVLQNKKFQFPNGDTVDEFEAVIVDFVYRNDYYMTAFNAKDPQAPACFAISDTAALLEPSKKSPVPQSPTTCSVCQHDQFGSSPTGGGKACKNSVNVALLAPDADMDSPIMSVKLSPTAISHFNKFVAKVGRTSGFPVYAIKARVFFSPEDTYASVRFDALGVNPILETTLARREEARDAITQEPDTSSFKLPEVKGRK